jgi:hypothetical protein
MYEENETNHSSNYEGIFARQPDSTSSGVWGSREVHEEPLGPNVVVDRDWYGNVTKVEQSWFNW